MGRAWPRLAGSAALVLLAVPGWSGDTRLDLLGARARVTAVPVALDPDDPSRRRVGRLAWIGGLSLTSPDPAFGGFSSLAVRAGRVTLLSDGGNVVSFALRDGRVVDPRFANLPAGPGTGWQKSDRDSESMAVDPATGQTWIGFENANAIWRYAPGFARATGRRRPAAMRHWPPNGGPESLARLPDGRFVVIREVGHTRGDPWRDALVFAGDPVDAPLALRFRLRVPAGYDASDAAGLPDGSMLVLLRRFRLPYRWDARLVLVPAATIREGVRVTGEPVAAFDAPLVHDNLEGVAVTRGRHGETIVWLCSDDNQMPLQRSLLLAFRLDPANANGPRSR